ncbi:MAG: PDZ domain-containing protein [Bdellovibrionaceae bacterium]|nr:PDZ domain-containing protein [Pseudobdellovibrionaceae bacterium]
MFQMNFFRLTRSLGLGQVLSLILSLFMISGFSIRASASPSITLSQDQKMSDLQQLVSMIKSGYGPLQYKKENFSIDVDSLHSLYTEKILKTQSNGEFYYSLIRFIAEFHDGHFSASLPTSRMASLPFDVDLVQGHVLIDKINRDKLNEKSFPYAKGDEIVAVNGHPIGEVLNDLQRYRGLGFSLSEKRITAMALTTRNGMRMPVPSGEVVFSIRRGLSNVIDDVKLNWEVTGEAVDEEFSELFRLTLDRATPKSADYDDLSIFDLQAELENPSVEKSFRCSGVSRIERPKSATVIMEKPFVAYYYSTPQGNIGYLRIPHYSPERDSEKGESEEESGRAEETRFRQYEYAVAELEKNTVGLVIDQDHNCGGSVDYLHRIVSLFVQQEFIPMQFQFLANKQEYLNFSSWAAGTPENTIARQQLEIVRDLVKDSWLQGKFMTPLTSIDGVKLFQSNKITYTKPIVVLIDEMSGSGGDAFPALMKGLGRAKLLGTRTMGLGGHVTEQPALYYSQIKAYMTKSLFYRPDGVAVENNGAVPDYPYEITRDDFIYGYHGYRQFYTQKLLELVAQK